MTTTFNFETREQYIEWRKQWREEYKSISIAIRAARNAVKAHHRAGVKESENLRLLLSLYGLRYQANQLLATREASKIAAGEARARRLEAVC